MPHVPGLRSPYAKVGRLVYFGRMLDKIRLHARNELPADYLPNLGRGFDGRICRFLGVDYHDLSQRALSGATDEELKAWVQKSGTPHRDAECELWNSFMMKRGWRDDASAELRQRVEAQGYRTLVIETFFDLIDYDEGRDPVGRRAWELRPAQVALVMGVSGSGKTTIGRALAGALGWRFADGDDFHPLANITKMREGQPLTDEDRQPWLESLRTFIAAQLHDGESCVVACSALKARYRDVLVVDPASVMLVYLRGSREVLLSRLVARLGHFMPASLLDTQLAALEEPDPATALVCDIAQPADVLVAQIRAALED